MSEQWRILVVEDDEHLKQSIVNSLRKDGFFVQGTRSGAEVIHILWSEEYDVIIGDLKTPGADGLEMLQWLRTYRPNTRMIMIAAVGSPVLRTQALEGGVVSYLEKPLDLHLLKEELRRLLQQTGFSANLDAFDLLDVIQIITMNRKSIALMVNTGLEERGILGFQGGELVWAEYGILRGEEAFFALAAYKNGTVTQQSWNEQITPNVTLPLSRLIFQALQYRSKYAAMQQPTGEQEAMKPVFNSHEVDDSPFLVLAEAQNDTFAANEAYERVASGGGSASSRSTKDSRDSGGDNEMEWWEPTGKRPIYAKSHESTDDIQTTTDDITDKLVDRRLPQTNGTNITPSTVRKTPASQRADLPSWLTDQPTNAEMPILRPSSLANTTSVPSTPVFGVKSSPAEWQPMAKTTEQLLRKQVTGPQKTLDRQRDTGVRRTPSPEWRPPERADVSQPQSEVLQSLSPSRKTSDALPLNERKKSGSLKQGEHQTNTAQLGIQRTTRRNYQALIAALQTLGYSITGFTSAAVVSLDGQPIAQVSIDDLDISPMCGYFGSVIQGALQSLEYGKWGDYQDIVITCADRHILLRFVGSVKDAFQVLITTREAEPAESLEVMANVESAIGAALR